MVIRPRHEFPPEFSSCSVAAKPILLRSRREDGFKRCHNSRVKLAFHGLG